MHRSAQDLVIVIIAGTIAILLLATLLIIYIFFYQKRQNVFIEEKENLQKNFDEVLMQSQIEVQEKTMSSIGRELHDNIGQLLSSAKVLLGVTQRSLKDIPETLNAADDSLAKAISELRALSKSLTKEWLEQFNLLENLRIEVARINAGQVINVSLTSPGDLKLAADKQIILLRIIQEALQNIMKHANAVNIDIKITTTQKNLSLCIVDDGQGFELPRLARGLGLSNMRQRTHLLGGNIEWKSAPAQGCTIQINIPLNPMAA